MRSTFLLVLLSIFLIPAIAAAEEEPARIIKQEKKEVVEAAPSRVRHVRRREIRGPVVVRRAAPATTIAVVEAAPSREERPPTVERRPSIFQRPKDTVYVQLHMGYSGLKGSGKENSQVFEGLIYDLTLGYHFGWLGAQVSFEGQNQWHDKVSGWPKDLSIYSLAVDAKMHYPIAFVEPYFYLGLSGAVYHPNPDLVVQGVDLWDWGMGVRVGVGVQFRFKRIAVGVDYSHRWYDFGGETEKVKALEMQTSSYRAGVTWYF